MGGSRLPDGVGVISRAPAKGRKKFRQRIETVVYQGSTLLSYSTCRRNRVKSKYAKDNPIGGNLIGVIEDFAKKTQEQRKALVPLKKYLEEKLRRDSKVFIAYHAILKFVDGDGKLKIVGAEDLKSMKGDIERRMKKRNSVAGAPNMKLF